MVCFIITASLSRFLVANSMNERAVIIGKLEIIENFTLH